ncbi:hypothetical protein [Saccharopolyspora sp. CA-218241]|uniref:hypothetical protein n=1 Tax=Saccharopolyspora sp. CA-218241 TaxID=3240027 RepID=UPI003D976061
MSGGPPAKDRPGRQAWLGPLALGIGLGSWLVPGGIPVALVAVACGAWSVRTRGPYRIDGTAVAGAVAGGLQVLFSLLLLAADSAGR